MKITLVFFALAVAFSPLLGQNPAFFPEELIVTASSLNLREAPDPGAKKIAGLPRGTVVQFVAAHNNGEYVEVDSLYAPWLQVRYQNQTGYVFGAHVTGTTGLYYEGEIMEGKLPPLQWYGVYARDSFADEVRRIEVQVVEKYHEFYGEKVKTLITNQREPSKFIVGTAKPFRTGYAGPLGVFETDDYFANRSLGPGAMLGLNAGNPEGDTMTKPTYVLIATGCAELMPENYVHIANYQLLVFDYATDPPRRQDLTPWVTPEMPEVSPSVSLAWYGDLDGDNRPDVLIEDSPYEVSGRTSLFLSSKAKPGQFLHKVCEHFWQGD